MKRYPYSSTETFAASMSFECNSGGHGRCFSAACDCWCHVRTVDDVMDAAERELTALQLALGEFFAIGRVELPVHGKE